MKISYGPLPFQMMKSEFEDTRKRSKANICQCNQWHAQYDLHMWASAHAVAHAKSQGLYIVKLACIKFIHCGYMTSFSQSIIVVVQEECWSLL